MIKSDKLVEFTNGFPIVTAKILFQNEQTGNEVSSTHNAFILHLKIALTKLKQTFQFYTVK